VKTSRRRPCLRVGLPPGMTLPTQVGLNKRSVRIIRLSENEYGSPTSTTLRSTAHRSCTRRNANRRTTSTHGDLHYRPYLAVGCAQLQTTGQAGRPHIDRVENVGAPPGFSVRCGGEYCNSKVNFWPVSDRRLQPIRRRSLGNPTRRSH